MPWPRLLARELTLAFTVAELPGNGARLLGQLTVRVGRTIVALRGVIR